MAFSDDMPGLTSRADLIVGRAGVGTIGEATAVGLPMVLVPGTFGGGHQEDNAAAMVKAGAAGGAAHRKLTPKTLPSTPPRHPLAQPPPPPPAPPGPGPPHPAHPRLAGARPGAAR